MLTLSSICRNSQPDNKAHVRLIVLFFFFLQRMFLFFPFFFFFFGKDTLQVGSHISCFSASGHYFAEGVEERLL